MEKPDEAIELQLDEPVELFPGRERLRALLMGLACLLPAGLLLAWPEASEWWDSARLGDIRFTGGILLLVGLLQTARALLSELPRLHRVHIDSRGLELEWSHVPQLDARRQAAQRFIGWHEVASIAWLEGAQDGDFGQHIVLHLHQPLVLPWKGLKLPVSEARDRARCQALLSRLPAGVAAPQWL